MPYRNSPQSVGLPIRHNPAERFGSPQALREPLTSVAILPSSVPSPEKHAQRCRPQTANCSRHESFHSRTPPSFSGEYGRPLANGSRPMSASPNRLNAHNGAFDVSQGTAMQMAGALMQRLKAQAQQGKAALVAGKTGASSSVPANSPTNRISGNAAPLPRTPQPQLFMSQRQLPRKGEAQTVAGCQSRCATPLLNETKAKSRPVRTDAEQASILRLQRAYRIKARQRQRRADLEAAPKVENSVSSTLAATSQISPPHGQFRTMTELARPILKRMSSRSSSSPPLFSPPKAIDMQTDAMQVKRRAEPANCRSADVQQATMHMPYGQASQLAASLRRLMVRRKHEQSEPQTPTSCAISNGTTLSMIQDNGQVDTACAPLPNAQQPFGVQDNGAMPTGNVVLEGSLQTEVPEKLECTSTSDIHVEHQQRAVSELRGAPVGSSLCGQGEHRSKGAQPFTGCGTQSKHSRKGAVGWHVVQPHLPSTCHIHSDSVAERSNQSVGEASAHQCVPNSLTRFVSVASEPPQRVDQCSCHRSAPMPGTTLEAHRQAPAPPLAPACRRSGSFEPRSESPPTASHKTKGSRGHGDLAHWQEQSALQEAEVDQLASFAATETRPMETVTYADEASMLSVRRSAFPNSVHTVDDLGTAPIGASRRAMSSRSSIEQESQPSHREGPKFTAGNSMEQHLHSLYRERLKVTESLESQQSDDDATASHAGQSTPILGLHHSNSHGRSGVPNVSAGGRPTAADVGHASGTLDGRAAPQHPTDSSGSMSDHKYGHEAVLTPRVVVAKVQQSGSKSAPRRQEGIHLADPTSALVENINPTKEFRRGVEANFYERSEVIEASKPPFAPELTGGVQDEKAEVHVNSVKAVDSSLGPSEPPIAQVVETSDASSDFKALSLGMAHEAVASSACLPSTASLKIHHGDARSKPALTLEASTAADSRPPRCPCAAPTEASVCKATTKAAVLQMASEADRSTSGEEVQAKAEFESRGHEFQPQVARSMQRKALVCDFCAADVAPLQLYWHCSTCKLTHPFEREGGCDICSACFGRDVHVYGSALTTEELLRRRGSAAQKEEVRSVLMRQPEQREHQGVTPNTAGPQRSQPAGNQCQEGSYGRPSSFLAIDNVATTKPTDAQIFATQQPAAVERHKDISNVLIGSRPASPYGSIVPGRHWPTYLAQAPQPRLDQIDRTLNVVRSIGSPTRPASAFSSGGGAAGLKDRIASAATTPSASYALQPARMAKPLARDSLGLIYKAPAPRPRAVPQGGHGARNDAGSTVKRSR